MQDEEIAATEADDAAQRLRLERCRAANEWIAVQNEIVAQRAAASPATLAELTDAELAEAEAEEAVQQLRMKKRAAAQKAAASSAAAAGPTEEEWNELQRRKIEEQV